MIKQYLGNNNNTFAEKESATGQRIYRSDDCETFRMGILCNMTHIGPGRLISIALTI